MIKRKSQSGYSLVELMVVMAVGVILLGGMVMAFTAHTKTYSKQQDISVLQEDMMVALQLMSRDIRMAGYDPTGSGNFGILTPTNPLTFATAFKTSEDLNNNGILDAGETIQYSLSGTSIVRDTGTGGQPVIDNITQLAFEYLIITPNGDTGQWTETWTQTPGNLATVRAVTICVQGRTAGQTSTGTDTNVVNPAFNSVAPNWSINLTPGYRYRTMCIQVECRNLQTN